MTNKGLLSTPFSEIHHEEVEWLWRKRVPFGKLTILMGNPDVGKTSLTSEIIARYSRGEEPYWLSERQIRQSLVMSLEDGTNDTLQPRLEAAGADLRRVSFLSKVFDEK